MTRRPPRSTRTDTLFPYTTLFRSRASGWLRDPPAAPCSDATSPCYAPVIAELFPCSVAADRGRDDAGSGGVLRLSPPRGGVRRAAGRRFLPVLALRPEDRVVGKEGVSTVNFRLT